jgi:hypothetical protein
VPYNGENRTPMSYTDRYGTGEVFTALQVIRDREKVREPHRLTSLPPPRPARCRNAERGNASQPQVPQNIPPVHSWPTALRAVCSWLTSVIMLMNWWRA